MAYPTKLTLTPLLLSFIALSALLCAPATTFGRKVGGRTLVKNVKDNKEIQELGRYCVLEYNRQHLPNGGNGLASKATLLVFSEVVAAETQVVSGVKYFLKISASTRGGGGAARTFEAVALVKPWAHSKELLNFAPSTSSLSTK